MNQRWSMDLMGNSLADGRTFRTLDIVDDCTAKEPAIVVQFSVPGERVVRELDGLTEERGLPEMIVVNNGPEFISRVLDEWAHRRGVKLHIIRPGNPVENAYVESFNAKSWDECLNEHWVLGRRYARQIIERSRMELNEVRLYSSPGGVP